MYSSEARYPTSSSGVPVTAGEVPRGNEKSVFMFHKARTAANLLTKAWATAAGTTNDLVQIIATESPIRPRSAHTWAILALLLDELIRVLLVPGLLELISVLNAVPMQTVTARRQRRISGTTAAVMVAALSLGALFKVRTWRRCLDVTGIRVHGNSEAMLFSEVC
jgi:hypothetical protein